jgi:hypothetical protein
LASTLTERRLTLVSDTAHSIPDVVTGNLRARPGDRLEPWRPDSPESLGGIAGCARASGIDAELASVLIVERALLEIDLSPGLESSTIAHLNDEAAKARVSSELTPTSAHYLRSLDRPGASSSEQAPDLLRLPMRLSDRILRHRIDALIRPELLGSAIAWERAAVLSGETMSEWALRRLAAG